MKMPWFVGPVSNEIYKQPGHHFVAVEADNLNGAKEKLDAMAPSKVEIASIKGPLTREDAKIEAYDQNSDRPYKIENIYLTLMHLAMDDPHVRFSSKHVEPPALKALIAFGKEPCFNTRVIALLLKDVAADQPTCSWGHLAALSHILGEEKCVIPKADYGRFDAIREHWLKWGDENGYPRGKP